MLNLWGFSIDCGCCSRAVACIAQILQYWPMPVAFSWSFSLKPSALPELILWLEAFSWVCGMEIHSSVSSGSTKVVKITILEL